MEPGLAAAAYAAETAIEGAAVGALALARSTVPLKARFYRIPSPSPSLKRFTHSLNVIGGRAYIFGGESDAVGSSGDNAMHVVTLPTDLELSDVDYQSIPAVGQPPTPASSEDTEMSAESSATAARGAKGGEMVPSARAGHCASVIGERIYVFGGSFPIGRTDSTADPMPGLDEDGNVYVFDTRNKTWTLLRPDKERCKDGVPGPRNYASSSSSVHPLPIRSESGPGKGNNELATETAKLRMLSASEGEALSATDDQKSEGYGTIFVHGGYDSDWHNLRDVWALM